MKKKDFLLIAGVLTAALLCWAIPRGMGFFAKEGEKQLKISVKGELYGTYSLKDNQTIEINGTNVCKIKDGKVNMTEAKCPDKLCMHQGPVSIQGETIVCLPNRVVLEIFSGNSGEQEIDSLVQ